jgi:predicted transcriptional regulator
MKTIAQIAREIGVSKQAVHQKIKQEPLSTSLRQLTSMKGRALTIDVDGESLIKSAFNENLVDGSSTKVDTSSTEIDEPTSDFIKILKEQIDVLNAQNEDLRQQLNDERVHSRKQADEIIQLAQQSQKLAENAQTLHAMENVKPKRQGFFSRLLWGSQKWIK